MDASQKTGIVGENDKLFSRLINTLVSEDIGIFRASTTKVASWLCDARAYYPQAKPKILEVIETAHATLLRQIGTINVDRDHIFNPSSCPPTIRPWIDAYVLLVRSIAPFATLFYEPHLAQRLRQILISVQSLGVKEPLPPLQTQFGAYGNNDSRSGNYRPSVRLPGPSSQCEPPSTRTACVLVSSSRENTPAIKRESPDPKTIRGSLPLSDQSGDPCTSVATAPTQPRSPPVSGQVAPGRKKRKMHANAMQDFVHMDLAAFKAKTRTASHDVICTSVEGVFILLSDVLVRARVTSHITAERQSAQPSAQPSAPPSAQLAVVPSTLAVGVRGDIQEANVHLPVHGVTQDASKISMDVQHADEDTRTKLNANSLHASGSEQDLSPQPQKITGNGTSFTAENVPSPTQSAMLRTPDFVNGEGLSNTAALSRHTSGLNGLDDVQTDVESRFSEGENNYSTGQMEAEKEPASVHAPAEDHTNTMTPVPDNSPPCQSTEAVEDTRGMQVANASNGIQLSVEDITMEDANMNEDSDAARAPLHAQPAPHIEGSNLGSAPFIPDADVGDSGTINPHTRDEEGCDPADSQRSMGAQQSMSISSPQAIQHMLTNDPPAPIQGASAAPIGARLFGGVGTELARTAPIEFGPEMVVIAFHRGEGGGKTIEFQFDVEKKVMDLIANWRHRYVNSDAPGVLLTLACYPSADIMEVVNDIVDPDTVSAEKLFSSRACVWPQSGGMRLIVSYKSQDYTFPLAPPCIQLTPDGLVDLSPFLSLGANTIRVYQSRDMRAYTFVVCAHGPTKAQMLDLRKKILAKQAWLPTLKEKLAQSWTEPWEPWNNTSETKV